jgi:hypothetical protein
MLVSLTKGFVFLQMPKCASMAIEQALREHCQLAATGHPGLRHTSYRKYEKHILPYLRRATERRLETICLMREPIAWLRSWWVYRSREDLRNEHSPNSHHSTFGISFEEFVVAYLSNDPPPFARVGQQSSFVADADGQVAVDRIFAYEDQPRFVRYMSRKLGEDFQLDRVNRSPSAKSADLQLTKRTLRRLEQAFETDLKLYEEVIGAGPGGWKRARHAVANS